MEKVERKRIDRFGKKVDPLEEGKELEMVLPDPIRGIVEHEIE